MKSPILTAVLFSLVAGEDADSTGLLQLGRTKHKQQQVQKVELGDQSGPICSDMKRADDYGGYCRVYGDPHVRPFDCPDKNADVVAVHNSGEITAGNGLTANYAVMDNYKNGDYWLVKSDVLKVQGRLWANQAFSGGGGGGLSSLREVAISGSAFTNEVIIVKPSGSSSVDPLVTVNGLAVTTTGACFSVLPCWSLAQKEMPSMVVKPKDNDDIAVVIEYGPDHLNAKIYMPSQGGAQSGFCGNFDDPKPWPLNKREWNHFDKVDFAMLQNGASKVADYERLFTSIPHSFAGCAAQPAEGEAYTILVAHKAGGPTDIEDTCARICGSTHATFLLTEEQTDNFKCYCSQNPGTIQSADSSAHCTSTSQASVYQPSVADQNVVGFVDCTTDLAAETACEGCKDDAIGLCRVDYCNGGEAFNKADTCSD